jgi:hypothetical protein
MNAAKRRLRRTGGLLVAFVALALPIQALAGAQVPLKGADVGGFTFPATCDTGTALVVDIDGMGNATHVGRYAYAALECFNPASLLYRGEFTITAANGDILRGTYSGEVVDIVGTVGLYEQDAVVTGGTGRFAGASGQLHVSGEADLATGNYSQELAGIVSSPGSAKK